MNLILASSSPFRRNFFKVCFKDFILDNEDQQFLSPDIDEKAIRHPDPEILCQMIAEAKCDAIISKFGSKLPKDSIILTLDQVVICDGQLREKPVNELEARDFLKSYAQGKPAECLSGVVVHNMATGQRDKRLDRVTAIFTHFPDIIVDNLIKDGVIFHSSGSFTVGDRELGKYVEKLDGSLAAIEGRRF
jgi:septum formation protein